MEAQKSHLLQMRGLKPNIGDWLKAPEGVASFTDAWIETPVPPADVAGPIGRIFYRCVD